MPETDPFRHHPELRNLVIDPEGSFFRTFTPASLDAMIAANPGLPDIRMPDGEREACRQQALARRPAGDLWVFAYGSLMWDPALRFTEVRRAHVAGYSRAFCLVDEAARGTPEAPAVMAGLAAGGSCDGLVFRVAEAEIDDETSILWGRERIGVAYLPEFVTARTAHGPVEALAFVADPDADNIDLDLSHEQQVRYLATATGVLGSNLEYLENIVQHFDAMGFSDPAMTALLQDVREHAAACLRGSAD